MQILIKVVSNYGKLIIMLTEKIEFKEAIEFVKIAKQISLSVIFVNCHGVIIPFTRLIFVYKLLLLLLQKCNLLAQTSIF